VANNISAASISPDRFYTNVYAKIKSLKWKDVAKAIGTFAKIAFRSIIGLGLYVSNPSFFAIGFVAGIIWKKDMEEAVKKIVGVWKHHWLLVAAMCLGAYLSLPVALATASFFYAADLGCRLSKESP